MSEALCRTFVLTGETPAQLLWAFLKANWLAMARDGRPLQVVVSEYKARRSAEQNSRMWAAITQQIAEQAWVNGRQYSEKVWHEHLKEQFLPAEDGPSKRVRKGYRKWADMPDGTLRLIGSTTQLTTYGMTEYQTAIEAYATQELGVRLMERAA